LLTNRTKISLYQLITQFTFHQIKALIQKYGENIYLLSDYHNATEHFYDTVKEIILDFKEENILEIIIELINTKETCRNSVTYVRRV
jgi:tagatose-1,6-bisphosphate aldolase